MRRIWSYDGRLVPGVPYVKTRQAILLATKDQKSELPYHRDNNIFDDSPQCYRLQSAMLQHPPALDNYTRTGALLSIVSATVSIKRTMAEILCTRDSQCECGKSGKGALDRQAPSRVLCGPRMTPKLARACSMAQLLDYIVKNVDPECYRDLPLTMLRDETENYVEFDKILRNTVGPPIVSVSQLLAASGLSGEPRSLAIRSLMGGLPKTSFKMANLSCRARATIVYDESRRTMDPKLLLLWIAGGGKGTKRPMTDNIQGRKVK